MNWKKVSLALLYLALGIFAGFNLKKGHIQNYRLIQGNYAEVNSLQNYFNLDLNNKLIEYYDGEYFTSEITYISDTILSAEIEPLGHCLLLAEKDTPDIKLIVEDGNGYIVTSLQFRGKELIKIEHN